MKQKLLFYLNKLVPLLGDDVFQIIENGHSQSIQSYVVELFFEKFSRKLAHVSEESEQMKIDGYYGISKLRRALGSPKDFDYQYASFVNDVKDKITLHPSVLEYIKTVRPKLIVTTSPFDIIDRILSEEYDSLWFDPENSENFRNVTNDATICHIFGQAGQCNVKWVMGEEELLAFLHAWNNNKSLSSNFLNRFNNQGMLVLGCDELPNWIFRFLWYPLGQNSNDKGKGFLLIDKREKESEFEQGIDFINKDLSFLEFLERINYEKSENMYALLDAVVQEVKSQKRGKHNQTHDFFISYASEDKELAMQIKKKLSEYGLDVWIDKERPKELDGQYWTGISQAIDHSRYIMPIVTRNYIERFFNKKRICENTISALEEETHHFIDILRAKYNNNDDDKEMLSKIIPILRLGDTAKVWNRGKEVEIPVTIDNINHWSQQNNPWFWIFYKLNFKLYDSENKDNDTFQTFDWSIYKS